MTMCHRYPQHASRFVLNTSPARLTSSVTDTPRRNRPSKSEDARSEDANGSSRWLLTRMGRTNPRYVASVSGWHACLDWSDAIISKEAFSCSSVVERTTPDISRRGSFHEEGIRRLFVLFPLLYERIYTYKNIHHCQYYPLTNYRQLCYNK